MTKLEEIKVFRDGEEHPIYMDGLLVKNLDLVKSKIKQDWDFIFLVDGVEGGGKSAFAQQIAKYCDPTINLKRICFTPDEFKKAVVDAEKYQAIIYDEAFQGLNSRQSMTQVNRSIVSLLAEIRQKNLYIFIVLPTFFGLDKNVALWRSKGLFHIYLGDNYERGYWKFYNYVTKKYLYLKGIKLYDYSSKSALPNLKGRFAKGYVVDEKEYRKKKLASLEKYGGKEFIDMQQLTIFRKEVLRNYYKHKSKMNLTIKELGDLLGLAKRTVFEYKAKIEEENSLLSDENESNEGTVPLFDFRAGEENV